MGILDDDLSVPFSMLNPGQYIPLNPVKAGLVSLPEDWEFSRYREYVGMRSGTLPRVDGVRSLFGDEVCQAFWAERQVSGLPEVRALRLDA